MSETPYEVIFPKTKDAAEEARRLAVVLSEDPAILIEALSSDPSEVVRERAASGLRGCRDPVWEARITEALIATLRNPSESPWVLEMAADAVGLFDKEAAVPVLIPCLDHEAAPVRYFAAQTLGLTCAREALPKLRLLAKSDNAYAYDYGRVSEAARDAIRGINANIRERKRDMEQDAETAPA